MRLRKRLFALVLAVLLLLPGVLLSPALPVSASSSGLLGTGSADEINIIRLLDMALNKGGMSMSPSTIQAFLSFWWSSVQADLNTCIANVDTSITGTQAFVDALDAALESADHYDRLGQIIKKYVRFVMTMDYKSLSDFKQLLTQQGTFRRFLLSYVTDQDGNIAGTVDNKLAKYQLKIGFISMVRQAADAYIEEYEGYYLLKTHKPSEILPTFFATKEQYDITVNVFKGMTDDMVIIPLYVYSAGNGSLRFYDASDGNFIFGGYADNSNIRRNTYFRVDVYSDNWELLKTPYMAYRSFFDGSTGVTSWLDYDFNVLDIKSSDNFNNVTMYPLKPDQALTTNPVYSGSTFAIGWIFTSDARMIKVWKSLDAFKQYTTGKSNVYYTKDYSGFDESKDTGYIFTGTQYNGGYSHDIIQTTIDNSSEVNESTVNNIVNNYITNNYGDGSGSGGGSGSGSGSGNGWWNIGDGITAVIEGIASLLDFLLKLIGDLVKVLAEFLSGLLEIMGSFAALGDGFSSFLKAAFGFLPDECIRIIVITVGLMCAVGLFKVFKK